ncbi:MAG: competence/damage-inducible protein A [Bacteroidales bacterium]|nr:competence/damage-inducible protein A [Bacteroidales bacterium]
MKAEIISIGDELLIGQVVNTNASWMAAELNTAGIRVVHIASVADEKPAIKNALDQAARRADIILLTGGLGPTNDDITKSTLAEYFDSGFVFHRPTFEYIRSLFAARNYPLTPVNKKQAELPEKCTPLPNRNGTAPGMWFEQNSKIFISLPGVPFEMKPLMNEQVIPRLREKFTLPHIYHKTIMTTGMGESWLAEKIKTWTDSLPSYIKLAYLPQPGIVRLRLSATGKDRTKLETEVNRYCRSLHDYIPKAIFGFDDITLEEAVGRLLRENNSTLSTAESCTGGYIAHLITGIAGSSDYFKGSIVAYANSIKNNLLGVSEKLLESHGAVSREVVEAMALGARQKLESDFALATSGIAGPTGGTAEKPVGTVWIALAGPGGVKSKLFLFGDHRGRNIRRSALAALNMLRLELFSQTSEMPCEK